MSCRTLYWMTCIDNMTNLTDMTCFIAWLSWPTWPQDGLNLHDLKTGSIYMAFTSPLWVGSHTWPGVSECFWKPACFYDLYALQDLHDLHDLQDLSWPMLTCLVFSWLAMLHFTYSLDFSGLVEAVLMEKYLKHK